MSSTDGSVVTEMPSFVKNPSPHDGGDGGEFSGLILQKRSRETDICRCVFPWVEIGLSDFDGIFNEVRWRHPHICLEHLRDTTGDGGLYSSLVGQMSLR